MRNADSDMMKIAAEGDDTVATTHQERETTEQESADISNKTDVRRVIDAPSHTLSRKTVR